MWIDRYFYTLHHPEISPIKRVYVGFCPEGHCKPGDTERLGEWTKHIIAVEPRYKQANEYLARKWAPLKGA